MTNWKQKKEIILNLPLEQKRKLYMCEKNFTNLESIPTLADEVKNETDVFTSEGVSEVLKDFDDEICVKMKNLNAGLDLSDKISVFEGDITTLEIDAIVNAANKSLLGGGGVDGAIHRAAGELLVEENKHHEGCNSGEAKLSGGYNLPSKYVISTVGPRGEKPEILEKCYQASLDLLLQNELKSIAFPCISTGIYGYPNHAACSVALLSVRNWLEDNDNYKKIDRVIFCLFLQKDKELYRKILPRVFPVLKAISKL